MAKNKEQPQLNVTEAMQALGNPAIGCGEPCFQEAAQVAFDAANEGIIPCFACEAILKTTKGPVMISIPDAKVIHPKGERSEVIIYPFGTLKL